MLALQLAFWGNLFQTDGHSFMYIHSMIISSKTGIFQFGWGAQQSDFA